METSTNPGGPIHFLNIQYFFRIIYDLLTGSAQVSGGGFSFSGILALFMHLWLAISILALLVCALAGYIIVYCGIRIRQVREKEKEKYSTISPDEAETVVEHHRWKYITQLIESGQESDWRNAIIEADIMLDDMLTRIGLPGDTVGDKLKAASPDHFQTLQDAWEAHKVRNDIAHQGSAYELTNHIAYQTIQRFRNVFEEFHEI